jgi:hypothetical protein
MHEHPVDSQASAIQYEHINFMLPIFTQVKLFTSIQKMSLWYRNSFKISVRNALFFNLKIKNTEFPMKNQNISMRNCLK